MSTTAEWTDDQLGLRDAIERLGPELSAGHVQDDRAGTFRRDKWEKLAQTGIFGLPVGAAAGGLGQDLRTTMFVLEGLGKACRDGGLNFSATTHLASTVTPLARFGSAALKQRLLPDAIAGSVIGAHAITEPSAGSDAMSLRTAAVATADGSRYVLNGSKAFVSNGPIADVVVVYARTGQQGSATGTTAIVVERDRRGLSFGAPIAKMGLGSAPLCELFLDDVEVPSENVLGKPGLGFLVLDHVMKREILYSFVVNVGEMDNRLHATIEYAKQRHQFGQPISSFQSVANKIVDIKIALETSRHWLYATAAKLQSGRDVTVDMAIAKILVSDYALSTALAAVQLLGGYGYMAEYGVEKDLRNAVAGTIYSGTNDIQRTRIAAMLGL
ncbi:acyl-CoA dehydrogenase family protein [Nocardia sp. NPDC057227]|uniref:acyl-CoA dehydrogenase family protein n=1 Tax=Nocardia sp. NPDC057227 TaxID=3346056 RepID=UPI00364195AF